MIDAEWFMVSSHSRAKITLERYGEGDLHDWASCSEQMSTFYFTVMLSSSSSSSSCLLRYIDSLTLRNATQKLCNYMYIYVYT